MKRYKIRAVSDTYYDYDFCEEEDPNGEWVKHSDVEKEMKRIWGDIMPPPSDMLKAMAKGA